MGTPSVLPSAQPKSQARWAFATALALGLGAIAWHAASAEGPRMPPSLVLLIAVPPLATLFVGGLAGHAGFALSLAIMIGHWAVHPSALPAEMALRFNTLIVFLVTHFWVYGYGSTFRMLRRQNLEQQKRIEERLQERAELTRSVSADLNGSVERLGAALALPDDVEPSVLAPVQRELERVMDKARNTLHFRKEPDLHVPNVVPAFRRRMTRWLFGFAAAMVTLTLVRVLLTGKGPLAPTVAAFVVYIGVFAASELWPERRELCVATHTVAACLAVGSSAFYWGFHEPPPNLLFFTSMGYNAFLIGGGSVAVFGIVGACVLALATAGALGAATTAWGAQLLACMVILTIVMQACWYLLEQRVLAIFASAQHRAAELERLDGFRARISGTLFHDVSNIVQVIGMTVQLAARAGLRAEDLDTLRRFHERLAALVRAALEVLERGELSPAERIVRAPLEPMFGELRELFQYRLENKHQTLRTAGETQLQVLTVPELLRDSILANLISNAIKFSPEGGTIALTAQRTGEQAEIVVRDQGPGFPDELIEKLAAGRRVESTEGTAGEQGLGLGLTLASEHMRRIGGELRLRKAQEGGGEAVVHVPLATPP